MSKLVEEGDDVAMAEKGWLAIGAWRREVAEHAINSSLVGVVLDQMKDRRMAILALSRVEIQIKVANAVSTSGIFDVEASDILMPAPVRSDGQLRESQSQ